MLTEDDFYLALGRVRYARRYQVLCTTLFDDYGIISSRDSLSLAKLHVFSEMFGPSVQQSSWDAWVEHPLSDEVLTCSIAHWPSQPYIRLKRGRDYIAGGRLSALMGASGGPNMSVFYRNERQLHEVMRFMVSIYNDLYAELVRMEG